jgi:hypothetical protein
VGCPHGDYLVVVLVVWKLSLALVESEPNVGGRWSCLCLLQLFSLEATVSSMYCTSRRMRKSRFLGVMQCGGQPHLNKAQPVDHLARGGETNGTMGHAGPLTSKAMC